MPHSPRLRRRLDHVLRETTREIAAEIAKDLRGGVRLLVIKRAEFAIIAERIARDRTEAEVAKLREALQALTDAWDETDVGVRVVETTTPGGFRLANTPEAWAALHRLDRLVAEAKAALAPPEGPQAGADGRA